MTTPSEAALRDNNYVARLEGQILAHITIVHESTKLDMDVNFPTVLASYELRTVTGCKLRQAARSEDSIEHRHPSSIRLGLGTLDLPNNINLAERARRFRDDDVDERVSDVL